MKKISTSALAKIKNIQPADLFDSLQSSGYIIRSNEVWNLTDLWKKAWWEVQRSEKFWQYIVWPDNLVVSIPPKWSSYKWGMQINATLIGEHFHISSQRLNLILSELGLIEKDVAGWKITKLWRNLWGTEHRHDVSWAYYVLWNESILTYQRLLEAFDSHMESSVKTEKKHEPTNENTSIQLDNFRDKFPPIFRTLDWHRVRSKAEMIIDNLLYHYGLVHAYERKPPSIEEDMCSDFYIPSGNWRPQGVYIEYWGLENDEKYLDRKKKKIALYKENGLALIELNEWDIQNLDDVLPRKLLNFKIKVY